jgi:hypothetical protein
MTTLIIAERFFLIKVFLHGFTSDSFICGGKCHRPWHYGGKHSLLKCRDLLICLLLMSDLTYD